MPEKSLFFNFGTNDYDYQSRRSLESLTMKGPHCHESYTTNWHHLNGKSCNLYFSPLNKGSLTSSENVCNITLRDISKWMLQDLTTPLILFSKACYIPVGMLYFEDKLIPLSMEVFLAGIRHPLSIIPLETNLIWDHFFLSGPIVFWWDVGLVPSTPGDDTFELFLWNQFDFF